MSIVLKGNLQGPQRNQHQSNTTVRSHIGPRRPEELVAFIAMEEVLVVEQGVVKAQRWVWLDDMRSWLPVNIPISHRGAFPHYPDVKSAKDELLSTVSTLYAAFGNDTTKLVVGGMRRGDTWKTSFKLNEDPKSERLLPDDWAINENWALIVYALWPAEGSTCDGGTNYNAKQQRAIEHGTYDDEYDDPVKEYVANHYSKEGSAPQCGVGDTSDAPHGATQSSSIIADDGDATQHDAKHSDDTYTADKSLKQAAAAGVPPSNESSRESKTGSAGSWAGVNHGSVS